MARLVNSILPLNESADGLSAAILLKHGYKVTADRIAYRSRVLRRVRIAKKGKMVRPLARLRIVMPSVDATTREIIDALEGLDGGRFPAFELAPPNGGWVAVLARAVFSLAFVLFIWAFVSGVMIPVAIRVNAFGSEKDADPVRNVLRLQQMLLENGFKVPKGDLLHSSNLVGDQET